MLWCAFAPQVIISTVFIVCLQFVINFFEEEDEQEAAAVTSGNRRTAVRNLGHYPPSKLVQQTISVLH